MDERDLIDEQIHYYSLRASEYDATATPPDDPLAPQVLRLEAALCRFRPTGRVLEFACGTGTWTLRLLREVTEVTALDSSPEMLALNRQRVGEERVGYVEADVFSWEPDDVYDVVFFANWLSHVPPARFEDFWRLVDKSLAPKGRVFFVDEAEDASRHKQMSEEWLDHATVRRTLLDGSTHRVIKVFWTPDELVARLHGLGWAISARSTGAFFWAQGGGRGRS
jgi:2-polyprenyl-3-methyl-5-hydroxy-6-metoxy-1,4-benzoquinol methylase